jgi:hypothetical protein
MSEKKETTKFIVGIYDDDDIVLNAAKTVKKAGAKIHEVYSPFPIHGIDDVLGYKRSRLSIAAFLFGATGLTLALTMQTTMMGYDWPMNVGGKNFAAFPNFVPISFELTVLLTALGMVTTFLIASKLGPGSKKLILDPRFSDDKFVLALDIDKNKGKSSEELLELLKQTGASETFEKEVENKQYFDL